MFCVRAVSPSFRVALLFFLQNRPGLGEERGGGGFYMDPRGYWWPLGQWGWAHLGGNPRSPAQVEHCWLRRGSPVGWGAGRRRSELMGARSSCGPR